MSTTDTRPASRGPVALEQAGLEGHEGDRADGGHGDPAGVTGVPATPEGMSTASTGVPGRRPGARYSPWKPVP